MFELAAFRKAHPSKQISIQPLFLVGLVAACGCWLWLACAGSVIFNSLTYQYSWAEVGNPHYIWVFATFIFLPLNVLVHFCRKKYQEKDRLLQDLQFFQLDGLSCETDFDRDFIRTAINEWYGGTDAFTSFVRGPLCEELLSMLPNPHLPLGYCALISTSIASLFLDHGASLYLAGADDFTLAIYFLSWSSYFLCGVPLNFNLIFYISDRLSSSSSSCMGDILRTVAGTSTVLLWNGVSMGLATVCGWCANLWLSLSCLLFHIAVLLWVFGLPARIWLPVSRSKV